MLMILRRNTNSGPATIEDIKFILHLSDRTIEGALRKLAADGLLLKKVMYEATALATIEDKKAP